jgi:hypothetical protein
MIPTGNRNSYKTKSIAANTWKLIAGIAVIVSIVAGIVTIITGIASSSTGNSGSSSSASTPTTTPAIYSSSPTHSSRRTAAASTQPAALPLPTKVPLLRPVADPGFSLVWHGTFTINAAGIRISSSGIFRGNPQDYDLAYQEGGDDSGWQMNSNNGDAGAIYEYDGTGTPDPAFCQRAYENGDVPQTVIAQVGDRDCYADANGMVGYMQVTGIGANGPTVVAWFWKGPPPNG